MKINIYTDGAAKDNPNGPGGYAAILQFTDSQGVIHEKEISAGYDKTTNNRMELMGVIAALEILKRPCEIDLFTDSQYITNSMNKGWLENWKNNEWRNSANKPVKNRELWERLIAAAEPHKITWVWIKGHNKHPENERCDALAVAASEKPAEELLHDEVAETESEWEVMVGKDGLKKGSFKCRNCGHIAWNTDPACPKCNARMKEIHWG